MSESPFDLMLRYQKYLEMVKLPESKMSPIQKVEMKRTFMGACGVMLVILKEDLTKLSDDEGAAKLQEMFDQVGNYFLKETAKQN